MPPRRETAFAQIEQRLGAIEAQVAALAQQLRLYESSPHLSCPSPVLEERVAGLEAWQKRQNGSIHEVDAKVDKIDQKLDNSVKDRQNQLDSVQKQISNNHGEILKLLSARDRQMLMLFVGIVVVMRAPEIKALGDALIKMFGGG